MTPKRHGMGPKTRSSYPPASPAAAKKDLFRKMSGAMERTFKKVAEDPVIVPRSIAVSRETVRLIPMEIESAEDLSVLLAAKALGLMQCMTKPERSAFLHESAGKVHGLLNKYSGASLFAQHDSEEREGIEEEIEAATEIDSFRVRAETLFRAYHTLCRDDVSLKIDDGDYYTTHWCPIAEETVHRAVIYARLADLTVEPAAKLEYLDGRTNINYQDWERLELFKSMRKVYARIADMVGHGMSAAIAIRRNATDLMDAHFSKGEDPDEKEDFVLYHQAKERFEYLEPHAKEVANLLITNGVLQSMATNLGKKFKLNVELVSHTSNPDELYRIKGPAGIFWKLRKSRDNKDGKYSSVEDLQDNVGVTVQVDGSFKDAWVIADWIRIGLTHQRAKFRINRIDIKDKENEETGYHAAHVVFDMTVDGVAVPCEIQVRTRETHEAAKMGKYQHGIKEAGITTEEHRKIMERVLKVLGIEFQLAQKQNELERLEQEKALAAAMEISKKRYMVKVFNRRKSRATFEDVEVWAKKGEVVGGIVALSSGFKSKIKVEEINGGEQPNGKLDLFDECPGNITISIEKGRGPGKETLERLISGKVITPEAVEAIRERLGEMPKKRHK